MGSVAIDASASTFRSYRSASTTVEAVLPTVSTTPSLLSDTEAKVVRIIIWLRTRGEPDGEPEDTSRWHETGQTTAVLHPNHPTHLSKLIEINGNDRWMEEDMNLLFEHF